MKEEQFKPIEDEMKIKPAIINLPENKKEQKTELQEETIIKLPTWNIEPPIEIKRGQ